MPKSNKSYYIYLIITLLFVSLSIRLSGLFESDFLVKKPASTTTIQTSTPAPTKTQDKSIEHLAKIYSDMPAKEVAQILQNVDSQKIIPLFAIMDSDKISAIISNMSPQKALEVSNALLEQALSLGQ